MQVKYFVHLSFLILCVNSLQGIEIPLKIFKSEHVIKCSKSEVYKLGSGRIKEAQPSSEPFRLKSCFAGANGTVSLGEGKDLNEISRHTVYKIAPFKISELNDILLAIKDIQGFFNKFSNTDMFVGNTITFGFYSIDSTKELTIVKLTLKRSELTVNVDIGTKDDFEIDETDTIIERIPAN